MKSTEYKADIVSPALRIAPLLWFRAFRGCHTGCGTVQDWANVLASLYVLLW